MTILDIITEKLSSLKVFINNNGDYIQTDIFDTRVINSKVTEVLKVKINGKEELHIIIDIDDVKNEYELPELDMEDWIL